MPTTLFNEPFRSPSTTIVNRPLGQLYGYRKVTDRSSSVIVHAFPLEILSDIIAAGMLNNRGACAYILTDGSIAYVGESRRALRRLAEHAADPSKAGYAREAFVVTSVGDFIFDKVIALDLQFRLTNLAVEAQRVSVAKGTGPMTPEIGEADKATHDRIASDVLRLLFDAGCQIFQRVSVPRGAEGEQRDTSAQVTECADDGEMEIGVVSLPGSEEVELRYDDVWARGYWAQDLFIVCAGSEVRTHTNSSCNAMTRLRRDELLNSGVLVPIPGIQSRRRLTAAVAFASSSIASKVVCGAHTSGRWSPVARAKIISLARFRQVSGQ